jgi:hypothetical protein
VREKAKEAILPIARHSIKFKEKVSRAYQPVLVHRVELDSSPILHDFWAAYE